MLGLDVICIGAINYDYMFHWLNKCTGGVDLNDKMFMLEDIKQ